MILLIPGSLRAGSVNRMLAAEAGRLYGGPAEWGGIRMPLYDGDREEAEGIPEEAVRLEAQIRAAEAVVIATPEYNYALPGGLKNALDWLSRIKGRPFEDRPLAIVSATAGRTGGVRAQDTLRQALSAFRPRLVLGPEVAVANAREAFGEGGRLLSERYERNLSELMRRLKALAARS